MAQHRRRPDERPGDPSRPRKRPAPRRPRTDLSAFLDQPLDRMDDTAFEELCLQMFEALAPRDDAEEWLANSIIQEFGLVRRARVAAGQRVSGAERFLKTVTSSFRSVQRSYDLLRKIMGVTEVPDPAPIPAADTRPPSPSAPGNRPADPPGEPTAPDEPMESDQDAGVAGGEPADHDWRSRIAMVPHIDPRWPVLDRLGLIVDDLLSLRDRGTTDDEILERFPDLTDEELAACYACEAAGYRGPLEPPYPDDLAVIFLESDDQ